MPKKNRAAKTRPVQFLDTGLAATGASSNATNSNTSTGHKVWGSGSTSLARVAGNVAHPPAAKPSPVQENVETWPSLSQQRQVKPATTKSSKEPPRQQQATSSQQPQPQHQQQQQQMSQPQQQSSSGLHSATRVKPVVPELPLDRKREANAWSSNESSPASSPPVSPPLSPSSASQRGCRKVDGVMVSPEPVESPKHTLQRWVDAGRPAVAIYALSVPDAEFRAFKRAVSVVAEGLVAKLDGSGHRAPIGRAQPQRKRMRGDEAIDHETAVHLMADLARVDTSAARKAIGQLPISAPCRPTNNAVQCFNFAQVFDAPLPILMQPMSTHVPAY